MASYKMSLAFDKSEEMAKKIVENKLGEKQMRRYIYDELVGYEDFLKKGMKEFKKIN